MIPVRLRTVKPVAAVSGAGYLTKKETASAMNAFPRMQACTWCSQPTSKTLPPVIVVVGWVCGDHEGSANATKHMYAQFHIGMGWDGTVSYTHLTLPTIYSV